ncbi:50S ribosomal protein L25 [Rhodohalobacter sp. SW132]|uniref:50S ribosomal protein L25 n=1 Tax=Rhodohalobacter sp. SW132 TaxID=2293433 RepID=UPI000E227944|nr:50S ribosomal protein L25 [Rhodohalobacter sp. SW132]REL29207.1 50S ribosomal protein L25 [Rhodohalobacter sp. SW132]
MTQPEIYPLEGTKRESGRKESDRLRDELRIPAVLYGPKIKENLHFSILESDLEKILAVSQTKLQTLKVDGEEYRTMLKDVDFDPVSDRALHADFYVLDSDVPVTLNVPVRIKGTAIGVRDGGGRVFQPMRIVRIRVLPDKIPAQFEVDITNLEIGDSIHVSDIELEGAEALDDDSRTIVTIAPPKSEALFTSSIAEAGIEDEAEEDAELEEGEELEGEEGESEEGDEAEEAEK